MNNPLIGIIVPIYNVESYLRECLDSIINQTYKNLKIILVNDGSTDSSLNIAKEYARIDKRIILFDKENGGQSSARNVGIEYFCGNINIESIANGGGSQQDSKIKNIYYLDSTFSEIDYIIFIDSDDYWELNTIEKCLQYSENVDIVWFGGDEFYDGIEKPKKSGISLLDHLKILSGLIEAKDILDVIEKLDIKWFVSVCDIFINFKIIKDNNVRFVNDIISEDHCFGILVVLALPNYLYKMNDIFYHYRIRPNSTLRITHSKTIGEISSYKRKIYDKFQCDDAKAKMYHYCASMVINGINIIKDINRLNNIDKEIIIKQLTPLYIQHITLYLESKTDPFNIINDIKIAKPYVKYYNIQTKLAISYPKTFRFFYPLFKMAKYIKRKILL